MEVTPRLKTEKLTVKCSPTPSPPAVEERKRVDFVDKDKEKPDEKVENTEKAEKAEKTETDESKGFSTMVLVVIFATIIVVLIIVVVWLVSRNDRYFAWMRGSPPQATKLPHAAKQPSTHADLVNDAETDELAMYANLGTEKLAPVPEGEEPVKAKVEKAAEKAVAKAAKAETAEAAAKAAEDDLDSQIDALAAVGEDEPSAISESIDAEVAKMDAVQHHPIEQVSIKTGAVVRTFATNEELANEKFDVAAVLQCCRGDKAKHRGYSWRFLDDVVAPF